ncbi:MAG: PD40 domain-containing protein [Haliscomenobacter sp.]|nr:PD40 domain-containing protein [Haliscomenobacter sp.]
MEQGEWSPPRNLRAPVNSPGYETQPTLSANGNTLLWPLPGPAGLAATICGKATARRAMEYALQPRAGD